MRIDVSPSESVTPSRPEASCTKPPHHVAIIMDGNGRWAVQKGKPRIYGHIRGSSRVRPIVRECGRLGVKFLTLFAFSSENWGRPLQEVQVLMRILEKYLIRERKTLVENQVRLRAIGDVDALPYRVRQALLETVELTKDHKGLTLTFALSYGARQEIVGAVKKLAEKIQQGEISPNQIDEQLLGEQFLMTRDIPDPDLIIRTSGEQRLSNFLLWQCAYSEFLFLEKNWPEFTLADLHDAFANFMKRQRRFGLLVRPEPVT